MDLLLDDGQNETEGFRHVAFARCEAPAIGRDRWVINKLRALCSWYTKGFEGGGVLRTAVNTTQSLAQLREHLFEFFLADGAPSAAHGRGLSHR